MEELILSIEKETGKKKGKIYLIDALLWLKNLDLYVYSYLLHKNFIKDFWIQNKTLSFQNEFLLKEMEKIRKESKKL